MDPSKKQFIFRMIFILLFVMANLACAEVGLRVYHWIKGQRGYTWVPDYYLGHVLAKNNKFTYEGDRSHAEFVTHPQTNNFGLMGARPIKEKKEDGAFRIVILGDSFTEGMQVEEDRRYTTLLENLLNRHQDVPDRKIEIINAGVRGYSPMIHYLSYKKKIRELDPDLVVLQLFTNDVFEDNKYTKMSVIGADGLPLKINEYFLKEYVEGKITYRDIPEQEPLHIKLHRFMTDHSKFYEYVYTRMVRRNKKNPTHLEMMGIPQFAEGYQFFIVQNHSSQAVFGEPDFRARAWGETRRYLSALKQEVEGDDAGFMMFYIPIEAQLSLEKFGENGRLFFGDRQADRYLNERLAEFANEEQVPFFDLFDTFEANKEKGLYLNWDGHLTAAGHEVVAQALSDYIIEGCLPGQNYAVVKTTSPN